MKRNRMFLLAALCALFAICFIYMNVHYDPLGRNTSVTNQNRTLLLEKLNTEEIRYIVENNIDVNVFYEFLYEPLFRLDYYRMYRLAMDTRKASAKEVVSFVNAVYDKMESDDLTVALTHYPYPVLRKMIVDRSPYNQSAEIVLNPDDTSVLLNLKNTIGEYEPLDLTELAGYSSIAFTDSAMRLREEAANNLSLLCAALEDSYHTMCGGIVIERAFESYQEIQSNYTHSLLANGSEAAFEQFELPSHNEHQLGLSVDVAVAGTALQQSEVYHSLRQISEQYGFVFYTQETNSVYAHRMQGAHMRYVGASYIEACKKAETCWFYGE